MMKSASFLLMLAALGGCASQTVKEIGREPVLSAVDPSLGATSQAPYDYPAQAAAPLKRSSLWDDRQSRLFTDPRALAPGDILTVRISINDRARFKNESERGRTSNRSLNLGGTVDFGPLQGSGGADGEVGSGTTSKGTGATSRSESLDLSVAAVVTNVLPNGNLLIRGSQEVRVNAELRILTLEGIVRPADIGAQNTINYERIAEARISYGGRGRLTEVQQPPYGQQVLDTVLPF